MRTTYVFRCIGGMLSNLTYLFSIKFISFSKATVIVYTCPVFTAVFGNIFLNEKLSIYDWSAVFIAFSGILMIFNPFA